MVCFSHFSRELGFVLINGLEELFGFYRVDAKMPMNCIKNGPSFFLG